MNFEYPSAEAEAEAEATNLQQKNLASKQSKPGKHLQENLQAKSKPKQLSIQESIDL